MKRPLDKERAHMICPHLKRTVMPICRAKKGALTAPNIYELQYYCMSVMYKECPVFERSRSRTKAETKKEKKNKDKDAIT
jgi:hypothetical protein